MVKICWCIPYCIFTKQILKTNSLTLFTFTTQIEIAYKDKRERDVLSSIGRDKMEQRGLVFFHLRL